MAQQTALDFFLMKLVDLEIGKTFYANQHQDLQDAFKQAKQMEKEQIIDAKNDATLRSPEQYYNETYGGNKQECQFEPDSNLTSATKCKWCGQEKWQHETHGGNK